MPYPQDPDISTSYTAFEQSQGDGSFPGQELDVDLVALRDAIATVNAFLKGVTRSDGKLANQSVGREQLAAEVLLGFGAPTAWQTGTAYTATNTVFQGTGFYLCNVDHTSGTFATDLASGRWTLLADINASGALVATNNLSDLASAASARTNLGLGSVAQDNIVPVARGGTGATTQGGARTALGSTATGDALFTAASAAAARTAIGATATGSSVLTAADAAAGLAALLGQARFQTAAGLGQVQTLDAANGASLSLPGNAAQTYFFWFIPQTVAGGALSTSNVGVSPGGTLLNSGSAGVILRGFCIRVT